MSNVNKTNLIGYESKVDIIYIWQVNIVKLRAYKRNDILLIATQLKRA